MAKLCILNLKFHLVMHWCLTFSIASSYFCSLKIIDGNVDEETFIVLYVCCEVSTLPTVARFSSGPQQHI